jgi:hypothetical protein
MIQPYVACINSCAQPSIELAPGCSKSTQSRSGSFEEQPLVRVTVRGAPSDKKLRILVRVENPDYSHLLENLTSYPERNREHFRVGVGPHDS